MATTKTLWDYPEYRKFYSSFFLGNVGDWFDFFALQILFAHQFNAGADGIVYCIAAYAGPSMLLSSLAGSIVDRCNKKTLLIVTDFVGALLSLALVFAPTMWLALFLIGLRSIAVAFNAPAQQVMSTVLLPQRLQLKAASYEKTIFQLCKIVGPMIGAIVVSYHGARACILINAVSFFLSGLVLLWLKPLKNITSPQQPDTIEKESNFKLTWRLIYSHQALRYFIPLTLIATTFIMMVELQLVILLRDIVPQQPHLFGYVVGVSAFGSVLTGLWLGRREHITECSAYLLACFIMVALGYYVMGHYHNHVSIFVFLGAAFLSGLGLGVIFVLQPFLIKHEIPEKVIGRVSGVMSLAQGISYGIGLGLSSTVISVLGSREAFILVAYICLVLAAFTLSIYPKMRLSTLTNQS